MKKPIEFENFLTDLKDNYSNVISVETILNESREEALNSIRKYKKDKAVLTTYINERDKVLKYIEYLEQIDKK